MQLGLSGWGLSEEDLYDLGLAFIRPRLANVEGASVPLPYGGKVRQVLVDVDSNLLYGKHLSTTDISTFLNQQNLILPAGVARMGDREFVVKLNSSPTLFSAMNDLRVRAANFGEPGLLTCFSGGRLRTHCFGFIVGWSMNPLVHPRPSLGGQFS